jgi:hypothetical protein
MDRRANTIPWLPELAEAYSRTGQLDRARDLLQLLDQQAALTGGAWSHAVAGWIRGLLAPLERIDKAFGDALAWHPRAGPPFRRGTYQYATASDRAGSDEHRPSFGRPAHQREASPSSTGSMI